MRYEGGKSRIAGWVEESIKPLIPECKRYVEPFIGSGAVFVKLSSHFDQVFAGDAHEDLILLYQSVASGWVPPEHISREDYQSLRHSAPSALRGFVGYGASFGGKWFGGYVDTVWDTHHQRQTKPYAQAASRSLVKIASALARAELRNVGYSEWDIRPGDLVYCDPPYANTLGYPAAGEVFNSGEFWKVAESWHGLGAIVVVSESYAPEGWSVLAERERKSMLRVATGEANSVRVERLFCRTPRG